MNEALVDPIAAAVLYEGYILYPYRPSVKNRQRWTFGGLYPSSWCLTQQRGDACTMQTECLVLGNLATTVEVKVRLLHLVERTVGELTPPLSDWPNHTEPAFRNVQTLQIGAKRFQSWQEARERQIAVGEARLEDLITGLRQHKFAFESQRELEPLYLESGAVVGVLARRQWPVQGLVEWNAQPVEEELFKLTVRVHNHAVLDDAALKNRDQALMHSLVSTHVLLGVRAGQFVSLMDPPERWRAAAAGCHNVGNWPVLVGDEGTKDMMLASPIILYDYPQIAPESPGDLFDGTEIDEILTLRILTLTEEEKQEAAAVDERARALLQRTEALAREQLLGLHGTVRGLRPLPQGR